MLEFDEGTAQVKIIGKTNVVLYVEFEGKTAQLNMRKKSSKWNYESKKDLIDWASMYKKCAPDGTTFIYRLDRDFARTLMIKKVVCVKLDEYLNHIAIEKYLLH